TTIWMRKKEIFRCVAGRPEERLGRGEQGWAALGKDGVYLAWIETRPGKLLVLPPGAEKPVQIADRAWDPVLATTPDGRGPVVVVWEEAPGDGFRLRAVTLSTQR